MTKPSNKNANTLATIPFKESFYRIMVHTLAIHCDISRQMKKAFDLEYIKLDTPWCISFGQKAFIMATPRCNIELANNRFVKAVEWNGEMRIDIREYDDKVQGKVPTRKGISLPLHR